MVLLLWFLMNHKHVIEWYLKKKNVNFGILNLKGNKVYFLSFWTVWSEFVIMTA